MSTKLFWTSRSEDKLCINRNNLSQMDSEEYTPEYFDVDILPLIIGKTRITEDDLKQQCQAWVVLNYPYAHLFPNDISLEIPNAIWKPPNMDEIYKNIPLTTNFPNAMITMTSKLTKAQNITTLSSENLDLSENKKKPNMAISMTESIATNKYQLRTKNSSKYYSHSKQKPSIKKKNSKFSKKENLK